MEPEFPVKTLIISSSPWKTGVAVAVVRMDFVVVSRKGAVTESLIMLLRDHISGDGA